LQRIVETAQNENIKFEETNFIARMQK
jgi:hypothetical protein